MVYLKRSLFLLVVISFLCNGLVDSNIHGNQDVEIQKDNIINSDHGVIEISKERDRRAAANLHKECPECHTEAKDWIHLKSPSLRSKRASKSKFRRKNKKRLKKLSDAPATNSKSFSNYFSSFWKDKPSSETQTPVKSTKKAKVKKVKTSKRRKTAVKTESSNNSESESKSKTKENSLLNHFSNFWKDDKKLPAKHSVEDESKTKKENIPAKNISPEVDENDSSSLVNHFASFWNSGESQSSSSDTNESSNEKSTANTRRNKKLSQPKDATKKGNTRKTRRKNKGRINKTNKNERKVVTKSNSDPKTDDTKSRHGKKMITPNRQRTNVKRPGNSEKSNTENNTNEGDQSKKAERPRKVKIRKTKANRRRLEAMKDKDNTKSNTENKNGDESNNNAQNVRPNTPNGVAKTPTPPKIVDFQGLRSDLIPEADIREPIQSSQNSKSSDEDERPSLNSGGQSNEDPTKGIGQDHENTHQSSLPSEASVNLPKIKTTLPTKSPESAPNPTVPVKIAKPRRKKVKNSSKKLTYLQILAKAESAFKKKNERIMKRLTALSKNTGKKYKKFKTMTSKRFGNELPTANFNVSHPEEQVSIHDMKNMVINLYNYSMDVQGDDPMAVYDSTIDYNYDNGDITYDPRSWSKESDYDVNSLIDLSRKSRPIEPPSEFDDDDVDDDDDDIEEDNNKNAANKKGKKKTDIESKKSSKETSEDISFLNYYSSFWKPKVTTPRSTNVTPKPLSKSRRPKNRDKRRKRKNKKSKQNKNSLENSGPKDGDLRKEKDNDKESKLDLSIQETEDKSKQKNNALSSSQKNKKKRRFKSNKKERGLRKRRKNSRPKRDTVDQIALEESIEGERDDAHHVAKRSAKRMQRERKSRNRKNRMRKRGRKVKGNKSKKDSIKSKNDLASNMEENHRSLDIPTSQKDDIFMYISGNIMREIPNPGKQSKRSKVKNGRRSRRTKSRKNRLRPSVNKRVKEYGENSGELLEKPDEESSLDGYIQDQGTLEGSGYDYIAGSGERGIRRPKKNRNKSRKSKSKRGRRTRLNRNRKRKLPMKDQAYGTKLARYDADERRYRDDDGNYYYAVRGRDMRYDDENEEYYYARRGRHSRRHLDDYDDAYRRGGRTGRRYYDDDYDYGGRAVYHREDAYRDDGDHSRGDGDSSRRFKNTGDKEDDDIGLLYYIYPVRRGSRRDRVDYSRRDPYPRRGGGYNEGYDSVYPRHPTSRWEGRDEYTRGRDRYGPPRQNPRYGVDSRRERGDRFGGSGTAPQEVRGNGGTRDDLNTGTHASRKDGTRPWRGDGVDDDYAGLDSGRGRGIPSRGNVNPGRGAGRYDQDVDVYGRRRPYHPNYYAELERRQEEERARMRERQRQLELQRSVPRVRHQADSLKRQLHGVLRYYTEAMARSEQMYGEIFNGTRYDIMDGMRDVYEDLNEANHDIYDAVVGASTTARSIFMKAHRQRAAQIKGVNNDEPMMRMQEMEAMVSKRDFRNNMVRAQREKRQLDTRERHFTMLKMKFAQGKARLQQVKELFQRNYDHEILLSLFNNMRASIEYVNEELACSRNLTPLRRNKLYLDQAQKEVNVVKKNLQQSREAVRDEQTKYMETKHMYQKYVAEQNKNARRLQKQRDQGRRGRGRSRSRRRNKRDTDPAEYNRLKRQVSICKRHSQDLNRTATIINRTLHRPIMLGKAAIQRRGRKVPMTQLAPIIVNLRSNIKEMFMTLDPLRLWIENQPQIILTKRCDDLLTEGSGTGDDENDEDNIDIECEEVIDTGFYGRSDDDDDDFVFETNDKGIQESGSNSNPMILFGIQLRQYTNRLLRKSKILHDYVHDVMAKAVEELRQRLQISTLGKDLSLMKDVQHGLDGIKSTKQQMILHILRISQTIDKLNDIDYEDIKARAIGALKRTKEIYSRKPTVVEPTTPYVEPIEPTSGYDNETTIEPIESSHWELFRKGKDIERNNNDIKYLETLALNVYSKSCNKIDKMQSNISSLMQKVIKARNMLSSLQLSISKTSDSPIPVPIPPRSDINVQSSVTTMSICIKPTSLDGTVLYLQGNRSASYTLKLDDGELTAYAYDDDDDRQGYVTLDDDLEKDKWYTIQMTRLGHSLTLSAKAEGGEMFQEKEEIKDIPFLQPPFIKSFVGGVPDDAEISGDPWQGCVGELVVNGQSLSTFQPSLDGQKPALCTDHCISQDKNLMWSFDGDGFVNYYPAPPEVIDSISVSFRTIQATGAILSVVKARKRFHLYVAYENGAVKVETSTEILRSTNNSLNTGTVHNLKMTLVGGRVKAELNGDGSAFSNDRSRPSPYRDIMDGVLMGGFVSGFRKYLNDRYPPLIGCVGRLVINGNPVMSTDTTEVYRAYYGRCEMKSVWQSCASFTPTSVPLSIGSVEDSNRISFFVNRNATGPLMLLEKTDEIFNMEQYKTTLVMTDEQIEVSGSDDVLVKQGVGENDEFILVTIEDDGKKVVVKAFGQSASVSYKAWYQAADTSSPHTISFGQGSNEDGDDEEEDQTFKFKGSLSQLVIGDRLYDLTKYRIDSKLESCVRALKDSIPPPITPNQNYPEKQFCS